MSKYLYICDLLFQMISCIGRKYVIKRFCEIHSLFNNSFEPRYILNQLYIKDFLIWLQTLSDSVIESLYSALSNVSTLQNSLNIHIFNASLIYLNIDF